MLMLGLDILLYVLLAWYFDQVRLPALTLTPTLPLAPAPG